MALPTPGAVAPTSRSRLLAHLTLISWLMLALSGAWLMFFYQPTASATYSDMDTLRSAVTLGVWIRRVHRWLVFPAALLPLAVTALHFSEAKARSAWIAFGGFVGIGGAWFTGQLLPWDQLALWAVTTGTNMRGFNQVFGENVRFVLIGGVEITSAQLIFWFRMHTLALPALLAVIVLAYWRTARTAAAEV